MLMTQNHIKTQLTRARHVLAHVLVIGGAAAVLWHGTAALDYRWRWGQIPRYFFYRSDGEWKAGPLIEGLITTLQLSFVSGAMAVILGLVVAAAVLSPRPSLRLLAGGYTTFMRGTPLLVQLYILYFMFGNALSFDRFWAGAAALAMFEGAFAAEIIRGGIAAVPGGQNEAAAALGLPRLARWRQVLLPQAMPLILPPLANLVVSLIKHSSIVTVIAIADLTDSARNLISETFLTFEIWLTVGAMYVVICLPAARVITAWERRLRR